MRPCINSSDIPKEMKGDLPVIADNICKERFCTICPYYGGVYQKKRRCMLVSCAWDDASEIFHPSLKRMISFAKEECSNAEKNYLEKKKRVEILEQMFAKELREDRKKKEKCYGCPYGAVQPCIGICYADLAGGGRKG